MINKKYTKKPKIIFNKRKNKLSRYSYVKGGTILNTIGHLAVQKQKGKDYSVSLQSIPGMPSKVVAMQMYNPFIYDWGQGKDEALSIYFNYQSENRIKLNLYKPNPVLSESSISEPYIRVLSGNRFLIVMFNVSKKQMMWAAEFENHAKKKTVLNFQPSKLKRNQIDIIRIQCISYPKILPEFKVADMSMGRRKEVFKDYLEYLKINKFDFTNKKQILTVTFNIKYNPEKGIDILSMFSKKRTLKSAISRK